MSGLGLIPLGGGLFGEPEDFFGEVDGEVIDADLLVSYVEALTEALPPGPLWDPEKDDGLLAFLYGLSAEPTRIHAHFQKIVAERNPSTVDELLPEWERMLALPDDCAPPALTKEARKAAVIAKFISQGGQRPEDYEHVLLEAFGLVGTVVEGYMRPFTTGDGSGSDIPPWSGSVIGDPLWDYEGWFTYKIVVEGDPSQEMRDRIECWAENTRQAHTTVVVEYV